MKKMLALMFLVIVSPVIWGTEAIQTIKLESKALNESRNVLIRLPAGYNEDQLKSYPVIFTLNDEDNFKWTSTIVDVQSSRFGIEDMIVVGLPHTGNYGEDNYPFKDEEGSLELNPQAENHSKFIREEVIPFIDESYRTNGGRFIVGHSLAGLFVAHLFTQYSDLFSTYIVLSPSLHYAPQFVKLLNEFFTDKDELTSQLYLSIGDMEHTLIQQEYKNLVRLLETSAPQNLSWSATYMENTDHMLAAYKGVYDSLAWIYKDWSIQDGNAQNMSAAEIINHYANLSVKLKYKIKPRKKYMIGLSGFLAEKLENKAAAKEVLKATSFFYVNSADIKKSIKELKL